MTPTPATFRSFALIALMTATVVLARSEESALPGESAIDWERVAVLMDVDRFWALVDEARKSGRSSCAAASHLPRILMRLSADEILAFELQLQKRFAESYRWDLWAVAYIVNGGASDDGFEYFRGWLIARGRDYFEAAMRHPERAADKASRNPANNECEEMLSPGFYAYWSKTKREMPTLPIDFPREPAGKPWDENEVDKLFPKLAARFRGAVNPMLRNQREAASMDQPTTGIELVLTVEAEGDGDSVERKRAMEAAAEILRDRLRLLRTGFSLKPDAGNKLVVRIPALGGPELERVKDTLTRIGSIEIRLVHPEHPDQSAPFAPAPQGYETLLLAAEDHVVPEMLWVKQAPELTGTMLETATVFPDQFGSPQVTINFTAAGRDRFAEVTRRLCEENMRTGQTQRLAIVIDGRLYSTPRVHEPITEGQATISGGFTDREAIELANMLNNPLQLRLHIIEERAFGP